MRIVLALCAGSSDPSPSSELRRRPRFDQRAIDGEVLVRQMRLGQLQHAPEFVNTVGTHMGDALFRRI